MSLAELTSPELIFPDLEGVDARSTLKELAEKLARTGIVRRADELLERLWEREQLSSTGIGGGVAIPHCKLKGLSEVLLAVGVHRAGVEFEAVDGQPAHLFFLVVSPHSEPAAHLRTLSAISRWLKTEDHAHRLRNSTDPAEILGLLELDG